MSFHLSFEPLAVATLDFSEAGGFVTFEGKVRNHSNERNVKRLEYEAYQEMAESQGHALVQEAIARFNLHDARVVHRLGLLDIGDVAVIVQTASSHRRNSFEACEWIMDQIKWRVPIWKRETYEDGVSEWVHSAPSGPPLDLEAGMFDRQIRLPGVGKVGQIKLQSARVLLVGVGGLATGSMPPLVGAGVGTLGLVDPDVVELSNLHRQTLFGTSDIGRQKVERAATFAKNLRPSIQVETYPEPLNALNVERFVTSFDWIIDGTDSLETKFLLNRFCRMYGKPLITASVHQFEGQIMTILPDGPCLQCLFPEIPPDHCVGTCANTGVLGVVPEILGAMQANEVIKAILGLSTLSGHLLLIDLLTLEIVKLDRKSNSLCPICSGAKSSAKLEWDLVDLPKFEFALVDIREPSEQPIITLPHHRLPIDECYKTAFQVPTVFVCATGKRSFRLTADLRARGNLEVFSLQNGIKNRDLRCQILH